MPENDLGNKDPILVLPYNGANMMQINLTEYVFQKLYQDRQNIILMKLTS